MIAIPCMQTVPTQFLRCLEYMRRLPETYTTVSENTLIHDARNDMASLAITSGMDRILWLDSDMTFKPDLLLRLSERMDDGADMVCGIYFKRVAPTEPVIYSELRETERNGMPVITPVCYTDYPRDSLFEVGACGFGAVMTSVPMIRRLWDVYGPPFQYLHNIGEDFSFCWRAREQGFRMWCDSSVKVGHIGSFVYSEEAWVSQQFYQHEGANHHTTDNHVTTD